MISARAGTAYEATLEGADAGLVGTLAITVDDETGTAVTARSTANIVELSDGTDPGRGVYVATRTAPTLAEDVTQAAYTLIWDEGDPQDEEHTYADTLLVWSAPAFQGLPSPSEVASVLRARTKDANSNILGEFTDDTTPTETQVGRLIESAAADVAVRSGSDAGTVTNLGAAVRQAIVYRAAMLVELSYWPEQTSSEDSAYARLESLYETALDGVQDSSEVARPEAQVVSVPLRGGMAFDPVTGELYP